MEKPNARTRGTKTARVMNMYGVECSKMAGAMSAVMVYGFVAREVIE